MPSVSDFLLERIEHAGIKHIFGVTGECVSDFFNLVSKSGAVSLVPTADEVGAGYAADAYARIKGAGCVAATYNVGSLKLVNAVAGAYAERSPLVVISGSPAAKPQDESKLLHMVRSYGCQKDIYEKITCACTVLDNPSTAGFEIDRVFEALKHYKQPIYIELPRDVADKPISYDVYRQGTPESPKSDIQNLEEAMEEVVSWLKVAKKPVILVGVETARFDLGQKLMKFAEKTNIPVAATLLSKSVVPENHPLYLGVYSGDTSQPGVKEAVDDADCLLMFGVIVGCIDMTSLPLKFAKRNVIARTVEEMYIKNHTYKKVQFNDFMEAVLKADIPKKTEVARSKLDKVRAPFDVKPDAKIKVARVFEKINSFLQDDMVVIADVGDSLYGASELMVTGKHGFIASALYSSMGMAIPGALGVSMANNSLRPIVVLGDGSFQMSVSELGTLVSRKLKPIIIVLNNGGYLTEKNRNATFNEISRWDYHKVVEVVRGGSGVKVETESDLDRAIADALKSNQLSIIDVALDSNDRTEVFSRMSSERT